MKINTQKNERDVMELRVRENTDIVSGESDLFPPLNAGDKVAIMGGPRYHGQHISGFNITLTAAGAVTRDEYQKYNGGAPYIYREIRERDLAMLLTDGRNLYKEAKIKKAEDKKRQGRDVRQAILDAANDDDVDMGDGG